jgi:3-hydroxybutyryl-CoA dehydrogenase
VKDDTLGRVILDRVVAMLINEAVDALHLGIATVLDLETAMTKGVNYPRGLLAWCDQLGPATVLATLEALQAEYGEDRYRPSPLLRRLAAGGSLVP